MQRRLLLCCAALIVGRASAAPEVDIVIRGGTIYTGAEEPPITGDVEVRGDRILSVGPGRGSVAIRRSTPAARSSRRVSIDPHTHPDSYIRAADPRTRLNLPWLAQGVSTVVVGGDGTGTPDIAADLSKLEASGIGTNVAAMVGFGAIRARVLGRVDRAPTSAELEQERALATAAMCQGALGLSTGLFYAPQSYAATDEVIAVAAEAGRHGGLYETHQRDESNYTIGLLASTCEAIAIGRAAGTPVHISHLKALGVDLQGQAPTLIATIEAARHDGLRVTADQYPWLASGSNLDAALVPNWAVDGGYKALIARLEDPATLARIRMEMRRNLRRRGGGEAILLTSAGHPWTGKTLGQVAAQWMIEPIDAALRILRVAKEAGTGAAGPGIASFNMADRDVDLIMKQPWVVTASDGSDGHPRQYASYPRKYRVYVRERRVISLGDFIRRSTGLTADIYRIAGRGYLRPGYFADVVVFDPGRYAPRATYVRPSLPGAGVDALLVNGRLALASGAATGVAAGRGLRRPQPVGCPA